MPRIQIAINSAHTGPWVERVGKLIINFSAIELECIQWLLQCSEDSSSLPGLAAVQFATRTRRVMELVEARSCGAQWRKKALRNWNEALALAKLRNRVAHNPIVFAWSTGAETGEPDLIGIPSLRGDGPPLRETLLSKVTVEKAINDMASVAQQLASLRLEWCAERDSGRVPPVPTAKRSWWRMWRRLKQWLARRLRHAP